MNISTEILVVGAGMAGVAAAISAKRAGKKVLLIDVHSYPGGAATGAEVGTICGLYENSKSDDANFLVEDFAREFATKFSQKFQYKSERNQFGLHYLPYKVKDLKSFLTEELENEEVLCMFDTELIEVFTTADKLESAMIFSNNQKVEVNFESLIDCSGNAIVASLTNHPMVESSYFQAASINFYVKNSGIDGTEMSNFKLIRALKALQLNGELPDDNFNLFIIPGSFNENLIGLKLTLPWEVNPTNSELPLQTEKAKTYVLQYFQILKDKIDLFKNAEIQSIASDLGWRTGLRPLGKYVLNENDVLSAVKCDQAVAKSAWPIEEWFPKKSVELSFVKENDFYQIPADCLRSKVYSNYFFAGRIISASDRAIASARVMGVCLQTGSSAGLLASKISSTKTIY